MGGWTRRRFGATACGAAVFLASGVTGAHGEVSGKERISGPLLEGYFDRFLAILDTVIDRESDAISRAAEEAADRAARGGTLYHTILGHLFYQDGGEIGPDRIGNPVLFRRDAASAKAGDFLLTMSPAEAKRAKENGVFVAGLTAPYFLTEETPPGALAENAAEVLRNPENLTLGAVCDIVIRTHTPWEEGILRHPAINTPLIPATSQITAAVYWALAGETAVRLARKGIAVHVAGE